MVTVEYVSDNGRLIKVVRTVLALAAAGALLWIGQRNASDLGRLRLHLRIWWLLASIAPYGLGGLWLAIGWRTELDAFGHRLPTGVAIRVWWRAQLARYVPTGLAAFASRAALARQEGVPAALGAASLAVELVTLILWGTLGAAVGLPSSLVPTGLRVLLGGGAAAGLVALPILYPWVAALALRGPGRRVPALATLAASPGRRGRLYGAVAWYGASVLIKTAAFVLFAAALVGVRASDAWLLGGAVQGAAVIGIIGITPAGLGVREGAMIGLLSHRLGTADAAAIAVTWRAYEFAFELGWLGVGTVFRRRRVAEVEPVA